MPDQFASTLDAALRYASIGWHVFPCRPNKRPHTEHGFHDASLDHDQIVAWWRQWPDAQIGVACGASGLCVIDLDIGERKDGVATFAVLCQEHGEDWCGLKASTPRGGRHLVFLAPTPPIGCSTDVRPGIDVRGDGGYVVVPSPASPGREWIVGDPFEHNSVTGESDLGPMPAWLEAFARGGKRSPAPESPSGQAPPVELLASQVADITAALAHVDPDPRETWIRVGMALKSTGARDQAYAIWCEWSQRSPKFDPKVQARQWASLREFFRDGHEITIATLFHMAQECGYVGTPGAEVACEVACEVAAEVGALVDVPADAGPSAARRDEPRPRFDPSLINVPGIVGDITEWLLSCSTRRQPALCLASAIATVGAVLGRRVATPTDLRTNVYCLGIGETACGKDASVRMPQLLLTRAGLNWCVGPGEWKSDSGMRAALIESPSHCAYLDEFAKRLAAMSEKHVPPHLRGIKSYLLEFFGAANSVHLAPAYADRVANKPMPIEQPNLCLYGTGVPSEMFAAFDGNAIRDGFLNRFLPFWVDDAMPERRRVCRADPPAELVERMRALAEATKCGDFDGLASAAPTVRIVEMSDDALALLADIEAENDQRILDMRRGDERDHDLADLWVRCGAHISKLALIRAVGDDPTPGRCIDVDDLAWARDVVVWCLRRTMIEARDHIAANETEANGQKVFRIVDRAGRKGITASDLTRATQWLRRSERKDTIATLIESGRIVQQAEDVVRANRGTIQRFTYISTQHFEPLNDAQTSTDSKVAST